MKVANFFLIVLPLLILISLISIICITVLAFDPLKNKPPIPDARVGFSPNETNQKYIYVTPNYTVYFDASRSYDPDGRIIEYYWQIGTGEIKEGMKTQHKYSEFGEYTATLTVVDNLGRPSLIDSKVDVVVNPGLNIKIKAPSNNKGFLQESNENIEFSVEVTGGLPCYEKPNYKFIWSSDIQGTLSKDKGFSISPKELKLGKHKITLDVEDCGGNKNSASVNISIVKPLKAEIIKICEKRSITLGRIVFDPSPFKFISLPSYGIYQCDNYRYALNIAEWLSRTNKNILIYTSEGLSDKLEDLKSLFKNENYNVKIINKTEGITYNFLLDFDQIWLIFIGNFSIYEDERLAIDKYHRNGGNLLLSTDGDINLDTLHEFYSLFGVQIGRISTTLDSENCIAPNLTSHALFKNVAKFSSSGDDLAIFSISQEVENIAKVSYTPYISVIDYMPITSSEEIYECNCLIDLTGKVSGGLPPYKVKWVSLGDGVFDEGTIENDNGEYNLRTTPPLVPPLREGIHAIKFEVTDSSGFKTSDTKYEIKVKWCCALDTICKTYWPEHEGPLINVGNEFAYTCDIYEVCHPDLWHIFREAITCCKNGCDTNCHDKCQLAYEYGAEIGNTPEGLKRCAGLYLVYGFGPEARFMSDYFWPEVCCSNIPFCLTECCPEDLGKCRCMYHIYTRNAYALPCHNYTSFSPRGWKEDTAMNRNSCKLSDLSAHMSVLGDKGIVTNAQGLNTGTCCDYANALTTALRIIGYKPNEVYSITGPGHCYNLVKFPKEPKWNIVDSHGNLLENPFVKGGLPGSYYNYCGFYNMTCRNDNGLYECPIREEIYGCHR